MPAWFSSERVLGLLLVGGLWIPTTWIGSAVHVGIRFTLPLFIGWQLGEAWLGSTVPRAWRILLGISAWAAMLSLILTGLYYLGQPIEEGVHVLVETGLGLLGIVFASAQRPQQEERIEIESVKTNRWRTGLAVLAASASLAGLGLLIYVANGQATRISLRTPWPLIPKGGFLLFAIPFIASLLLAWKGRRPLASFVTNAASWLSISLLTPLLYPLGYGFDGFIHRASEAVLLATGTLTPKDAAGSL